MTAQVSWDWVEAARSPCGVMFIAPQGASFTYSDSFSHESPLSKALAIDSSAFHFSPGFMPLSGKAALPPNRATHSCQAACSSEESFSRPSTSVTWPSPCRTNSTILLGLAGLEGTLGVCAEFATAFGAGETAGG